jgi:hypothetical protein
VGGASGCGSLQTALLPLAPPLRARTGVGSAGGGSSGGSHAAWDKEPVVVYVAGGKHLGIEAWLGGSIWASLSGFKELSVSKAEYAEHGANLFAKRCP